MDLIQKIESLRYDIENGVETDVIKISVRLIQIKEQALQLQQTDVKSSCNLHSKEIIKKLIMRPHLEDKEGYYDMVNDEIQMIKIVEDYLLKNYK